MSDATFYAKPVRVRAFQWSGPKHQEYPLWFDALVRKGYVAIRSVGTHPAVRVAQRNKTAVTASIGDWIVNRDDTIIVHKEETFKKLYAVTA